MGYPKTALWSHTNRLEAGRQSVFQRQGCLRFKRFAAVAGGLLCLWWFAAYHVTIQVAPTESGARDLYTHLANPKASRIDSDSHITTFEPEQLDEIPRSVWQLALGARGEKGATQFVDQANSWKQLEDYSYTAMTDTLAKEFVHNHYENEPSIVRFWDEVATVVVRADFLRYLILYATGGYYSDMDTTCLESPDDWIPEHYNPKAVNVIFGLERDDQDADKPREFLSPVSFTQWTLASKPGHPIFKSAIRRLMSNIEYLTRMKNKEVWEMTGSEFYDKQILAATGPGLVSDILVSHLRDHGHDVNFTSFYNIRQPTLFHDVLILPTHGFGANAHIPLVDGQSFVVHHFAGTWKEENNKEDPPSSTDSKAEAKDASADGKSDAKKKDDVSEEEKIEQEKEKVTILPLKEVVEKAEAGEKQDMVEAITSDVNEDMDSGEIME